MKKRVLLFLSILVVCVVAIASLLAIFDKLPGSLNLTKESKSQGRDTALGNAQEGAQSPETVLPTPASSQTFTPIPDQTSGLATGATPVTTPSATPGSTSDTRYSSTPGPTSSSTNSTNNSQLPDLTNGLASTYTTDNGELKLGSDVNSGHQSPHPATSPA